MHPLKVTLAVAAALALVVASIVGFALSVAFESGPHLLLWREVVLASLVTFIAFAAPFAAMYFWAWRGASENDALTDRVQRLITDSDLLTVTDQSFHDEVDDLARAVEELRLHFVTDRDRQLRRYAAMEEMLG